MRAGSAKPSTALQRTTTCILSVPPCSPREDRPPAHEEFVKRTRGAHVRRLGLAIASTLLAPSLGRGQAAADTTLKVGVGGFVDAYYAYDLARPRSLDRAFTTQAARHDEFNVNLAYLEATLAATRLRGRVAAQFGTSVQANYAG